MKAVSVTIPLFSAASFSSSFRRTRVLNVQKIKFNHRGAIHLHVAEEEVLVSLEGLIQETQLVTSFPLTE